MISLSELKGSDVPVHVHSAKDTSFNKKPLRTLTVPFLFDDSASLLFTQTKYKGKGFSITLGEPENNAAVICEFRRQVNLLNDVGKKLLDDSFLHSVITNAYAVIEGIGANIRDTNSAVTPAYQIKSILTKTIEDKLQRQGIEATCNIGRGTLYVAGEVVVNSGITQNTTLSSGLLQFFKFESTNRRINDYLEQYYKCYRGAYESGSWMNVHGDAHLVLPFQIMVLDATSRFLKHTSELLKKGPEIDAFTVATSEAIEERIASLEKEFNAIVSPAAINLSEIINSETVRNTADYKEIVALGLSQTAKYEFALKEGGMILLQKLANSIGADHVVKFSPKSVEDVNERHGYVDDAFAPHIVLPNRNTRKGMLALKELLEDPASLAALFIDNKVLKLNVSASATEIYQDGYLDYKDPVEHIDICVGGRPPFVRKDEIIRFTFKC